MKTSRVTKLERQVRSRPCPGCGRAFDPPTDRNDEIDFERLTSIEQAELAALIQAFITPSCNRCGRSGHDLAGLSDEKLSRALELLRTALGRDLPISGRAPESWA
ncbi:hypothetical protein GobsT_51510 [Gemmata obscuriglobus]|uniref:Uncharacterized protein n=1 Tax=Gemmata obscuriglobus TaxID=114 RepID=A0A2Z3GRH9_9BACT|nr:hypothetical protein [Gemmata obscuriglobus]AWM36969.1 hypothetical protein C1280_08005 [Gemmata obscuriglobus]QEG30346.1 hypothetical protein GobsT_51510 [Gemmata obscuriglobus]VTS09670.1 unnamed protein product [Gemmata obscuriglobus UQM 2246]